MIIGKKNQDSQDSLGIAPGLSHGIGVGIALGLLGLKPLLQSDTWVDLMSCTSSIRYYCPQFQRHWFAAPAAQLVQLFM